MVRFPGVQPISGNTEGGGAVRDGYASQRAKAAGVVGVGGGTVVAVVAAALPDTNPWKVWVISVIPPISLLASAVWMSLTAYVVNRLRDREVRRLSVEARRLLQRALDAPARSASSARAIQARLEELDRLEADRLLVALEKLGVVTSADEGS